MELGSDYRKDTAAAALERAIDSTAENMWKPAGPGTIRMQLATLEISHHPRPGHGSPDTALYKACSFYRC